MRDLLIAVIAVAVGCSISGGTAGGTGGAGGAGTGGSGGACTASPNACHDACNPCTKIAQSQVTAAVGVSVGVGDNSNDSHACHFEHDDGSGLPTLQVDFTANMDAQTFADICHNEVSAATDAGFIITPISGVGDDACTTALPGLSQPILMFLKGCWSYSVAVTSYGISDPTIVSQEETIALAATPSL
ncbi:MAG TPA: hypothetical protein VMT03_23515 [Polyangia bacterium]|nr:hypothetical protein [Polyangia bacterium]